MPLSYPLVVSPPLTAWITMSSRQNPDRPDSGRKPSTANTNSAIEAYMIYCSGNNLFKATDVIEICDHQR